MEARATCEMKNWKEKSLKKAIKGMKITSADADLTLKGDFQGKADAHYVMYYTQFEGKDMKKAVADYTGIMKMEGKIGDKAGTFAVEDTGKYEGGSATSKLRIIEGSGTGSLKGITGTGTFTSTKDSANVELSYVLTQ